MVEIYRAHWFAIGFFMYKMKRDRLFHNNLANPNFVLPRVLVLARVSNQGVTKLKRININIPLVIAIHVCLTSNFMSITCYT